MEALPIAGVHLARDERAISVKSDKPLAVTSSAIIGGDLEFTRHILNMHVPKNYDCRAPAEDLNAMARELGIVEPFVGMMTAARLDRAQVIVERDLQTRVVAIVTVGLSNPTAAGIETTHASPGSAAEKDASPLQEPGTINMILVVDARLPRSARVNAIITATEAKTLALVQANVRVPSGGFASGTSTDAVVVATTERGEFYEYAGPISLVGTMIGRAVRRAIENAVK